MGETAVRQSFFEEEKRRGFGPYESERAFKNEIPLGKQENLSFEGLSFKSPAHVDKLVESQALSKASVKNQLIKDFQKVLVPITIPAPDNRMFIEKMVSIADIAHSIQSHSIEDAKFQIEALTKKIGDLQHQQVLKLQEIADKMREKSTWDFIKRLASCILSAATIVVGGGMIAAGGPLGIAGGSLLITSGICGLTALALDDMKASKIAVAAFAITSAALGLVGGGLGFFSAEQLNLAQSISLIVGAAMNITLGSAQCVQSWTQYEIGMIEAELTKFQRLIEEEEINLSRKKEEVEYHLNLTDVNEAIHNALMAYQMGVQQIIYHSV